MDYNLQPPLTGRTGTAFPALQIEVWPSYGIGEAKDRVAKSRTSREFPNMAKPPRCDGMIEFNTLKCQTYGRTNEDEEVMTSINRSRFDNKLKKESISLVSAEVKMEGTTFYIELRDSANKGEGIVIANVTSKLF